MVEVERATVTEIHLSCLQNRKVFAAVKQTSLDVFGPSEPEPVHRRHLDSEASCSLLSAVAACRLQGSEAAAQREGEATVCNFIYSVSRLYFVLLGFLSTRKPWLSDVTIRPPRPPRPPPPPAHSRWSFEVVSWR